MANKFPDFEIMELKFNIPFNTPLVKMEDLFGVKQLFVKNETENPTHTFKDRLAWEMLEPIIKAIKKDKQITRTTFASISYGNTALSLGYYCKQLNEQYGDEIVNAIAFVPSNLKEKMLGPDTSNRFVLASEMLTLINQNCELIEIDLNEKLYRANDLEKLARNSGLCYESFIDVTEGLDRPAYEKIIAEVIEHQMTSEPDYIVVPFGAGILCNEVIDYVKDKNLKSKIIPVSSGRPDTIAIMLYGPMWVNTQDLITKGEGLTKHDKIDRKGRKREPYLVYQVNDDEILLAMNTLKEKNISCEPSAASGFAILHRLNEISPEFDAQKHSVLVINTGNSILNL